MSILIIYFLSLLRTILPVKKYNRKRESKQNVILKNYILFNSLISLDEIDSTNNYIRRQFQENPDNMHSGCVVSARLQTSGRGRKDRIWISGRDTSLTFSFILDLRGIQPAKISTITLAAGVGVSEALRQLGIDCRLKWPNDIYAGDKKLCGILSETISSAQNLLAICGVGINVNLDNKALESIGAPATSIYTQTARTYTSDQILPIVLERLDVSLAQWFAGGIDIISHQWMKNAYGLGRAVQAVDDGKIIEEGFFVGLGDKGQFLLRKFDGAIKEIWAGDIVWNN